MKKEELLSVFSQLRKSLHSITLKEGWKGYASGITEDEFEKLTDLIEREKLVNPWFTSENMYASIAGIVSLLEPQQLFGFASKYVYAKSPKRIGVIMAGNIPFVGFHDLLCVLLSGNSSVCKLSSEDRNLPSLLISWMIAWNPKLKERIEINAGKMNNFDAIIATGSNNSFQYFEQYFNKYPHVFRKNRTSIAVLDGTESFQDIENLSDDCFRYFGMGCRSVSKLYLPKDFELNRIFEGFLKHGDVVNHHKYANNYDYNRTIYLMNNVPFFDNNSFLLKEDESIHAPLSVIYYEYYSNSEELNSKINPLKEQLQVIVGNGFVPFGVSQSPRIADFADGFDTMEWLNGLK